MVAVLGDVACWGPWSTPDVGEPAFALERLVGCDCRVPLPWVEFAAVGLLLLAAWRMWNQAFVEQEPTPQG